MGWPMRGYDNAHSGRSPFTGPVSCPELRWQQRFGTGNKTFLWTESSPAVDSSGRVFVGSGTKLWALELATGSVIWQYDVADKKHLKVRVFALRLWWRGQGGKGQPLQTNAAWGGKAVFSVCGPRLMRCGW